MTFLDRAQVWRRDWADVRLLACMSTRSRRLSVPVALAFIVAGAAILRVSLLAAHFPLHHDEALYGYWAQLILSGRDPLLLTAWVDKPPLALYALAAALRVGGVSEPALRLPGVIVSLATLLCVFGLARRIYDAPTALIAAGLFALAPFAILFAPTAFTDPWLTLWLVAAAWAAVARRPFWAGIALGLAIASKQQGVLGAPLVAALLLAGDRPTCRVPDDCRTRTARPLRAALGRFCTALLGFALIFVPVACWDSLRWAKRPSFWDRSLTTYGGLGLAPMNTWPDRVADWLQVTGYLFGFLPLTAVVLGLAFCAARRDWRSNRATRALTLFIGGYLALHFLVTFQPWDRYLLPLLPFICVLAARGIQCFRGAPGQSILPRKLDADEHEWMREPQGIRARLRLAAPRLQSLWHRAAAAGFALLLIWAAGLGAMARLPVGSDHGAYAGLDRIAAFLLAQPADAIIYHRWLGWHFDFYLFDAPQERRWWGSGWKLAGDAARTAAETPERAQWVVLPGWHDAAAGEVRLALSSRRLALAEVERIYRPDGSRAFTVYRIIPEQEPDGG